MKMRQSREKATADLLDRGDMHGTGKAVVRGLAHVDVIVRMDRALRAQLTAQQLVRAIGDHLVGVHIGLGAGAGLPNHEWKVIVEPALGHLAGGPDDNPRAAAVEQAELVVHLGSGVLDEAERVDQRPRHQLGPDGEIFERALRLRAPIAVGQHRDGAEAVGLGAGFCRRLGR